MKVRIRKRRTLVVLVVVGQLACLIAAGAWFTQRLAADLHEALRRQVLADNVQLADQMARIIGEMGLRSLDYGSADWQRLQGLIENVSLPNEGFLCVVDGQNGRLVCHPRMRHDPMLRSIKPGQAMLHTNNSTQTILDSATRGAAGGWARMKDGIHLIAVRDLDGLDAKVMVHQRDRGLDRAAASIASPIRLLGLVVVVVVVLFDLLLTSAIVARYENRLAGINKNLSDQVDQRSRALMRTRDAVIFGLAKLAESRDDDTGQHLDRIQAYVEVLARELGRWQHAELDTQAIEQLGLASSLHDIGKVGIPDSVLLKPGRLTGDERAIIEKHPLIGGDCLLAIKRRLGEDDFLTTACQITFAHHERWDGAGYPFGLKGDQIPLSARIVALADVYDALTSRRVYKEAYSHERARDIITNGAGSQFDPQIVRAFVVNESRFRRIAAERRTDAHATPDPIPAAPIARIATNAKPEDDAPNDSPDRPAKLSRREPPSTIPTRPVVQTKPP